MGGGAARLTDACAQQIYGLVVSVLISGDRELTSPFLHVVCVELKRVRQSTCKCRCTRVSFSSALGCRSVLRVLLRASLLVSSVTLV